MLHVAVQSRAPGLEVTRPEPLPTKTTLMWAAQQGADSVELPGSYQQQPAQTFTAANEALLRNPSQQ